MNNEPVAWIIDASMTDCDDNFIWNTGNYPDWQVKHWIPLYTHPVKENWKCSAPPCKCNSNNYKVCGYSNYTHPVTEHFEDEPQAEELHEILQSNSHPVKELDEDFDAICLENKRLQAEIEKLRSWVEMLVEVPFFNEIDHYRGIPVAILRKASEK